MTAIPAWHLYGEDHPFPDLLHVESIAARAAGLEWQIEPHRHLHLHQVFLLTEGAIRMTIDGTTRIIEPPALVNVPPGIAHGFRFSAGIGGFVLSLPVAAFPDLFGTNAETAAASAQPFVAPASAQMQGLFETLAADHAGSQRYRGTLLRSAAGRILALALQVAPMAAAVRTDERMARFENLMAQHLCDRWTVADYAAALAVSPRHLGRVCRAATGLSPQALITDKGIHEACRLLAYTRMPVQQIAFHLGFDDPSYFSRVFQRRLTLSPSDYRARLEGGGVSAD